MLTEMGATMFTVVLTLSVEGLFAGPVALAKAKIVTVRPGAGFGDGTVAGAV
jgi:hypothetical protein